MKKISVLFALLLCLSLAALVSCKKTGAEAAKTDAKPAAADTATATSGSDASEATESTTSASNKMNITWDGSDVSAHEYTANYNDSKVGKICVIDFSDNGHSYELCINGLTEEFTDHQINTMIEAFLSEKTLTITGEDLIDAEKFSDHIYGSLGDWVFSDDYRKNDDWGDYSKCWAGSAADMLWTTGWAQLGMQNNPDLSISNVDDLFTFYDNHFINDAVLFQKDAIDFFIDGGTDSYSMDEIPGNAADYKSDDYSAFVLLIEGDPIEDGVTWIKDMKNGTSVGLSIMILPTSYPLKDSTDDDVTAYYDDEKKTYMKEVGNEIDANDDKIESAFYVYDDQGNTVKVEQKDDDTYASDDGKEYDAFNVLKGDIYPVENGYYAVIDDGYIDYFTACDKDDIDLDNGQEEITVGYGQHAITVAGYVIDVDETQPADSIKALFVTDSDNDAHYYNMTGDVRGNELKSKAERPNTIQMFRTAAVSSDGDIKTINLIGYISDGNAPIASVTGLKPAP